MKVHIAYDDGTLIGVYRKRGDAQGALTTTAAQVIHELDKFRLLATLDRAPAHLSEWAKCDGGAERTVTYNPHGKARSWSQWIDTHEVTK